MHNEETPEMDEQPAKRARLSPDIVIENNSEHANNRSPNSFQVSNKTNTSIAKSVKTAKTSKKPTTKKTKHTKKSAKQEKKVRGIIAQRPSKDKNATTKNHSVSPSTTSSSSPSNTESESDEQAEMPQNEKIEHLAQSVETLSHIVMEMYNDRNQNPIHTTTNPAQATRTTYEDNQREASTILQTRPQHTQITHTSGLRAGDNVNEKIKEKIWDHKYLDFYTLLYPDTDSNYTFSINNQTNFQL